MHFLAMISCCRKNNNNNNSKQQQTSAVTFHSGSEASKKCE
jgi:hypothetical protein